MVVHVTRGWVSLQCSRGDGKVGLCWKGYQYDRVAIIGILRVGTEFSGKRERLK